VLIYDDNSRFPILPALGENMRCPTLCRSAVITDNVQLAARMSCALAAPGHYVPILEGPRMTRDDKKLEVIRINNAAGRAKSETIFLGELPADTTSLIEAEFAPLLRSRLKHVPSIADIERAVSLPRKEPLRWGRDHIGLGLLKALRSRCDIIFEDGPSPTEAIPAKAPHLVVCEDGNDMAQVMAANYAYALGAGLCLSPQVDETLRDNILEQFYALYDNRSSAPPDILDQLRRELRELCGVLPVPIGGSITFVTSGLPFGFAVTNCPSTHIFSYPHMGVSVVNGFAAEQPSEPGITRVCLVDPSMDSDAREIEAAAKLLAPRGAFVRVYSNDGANVRDVGEMMEWFPYDLLLISTHCGDPNGYRWTYEFKDSEGYDRRLVIDIALSVGSTDDPKILGVTQFFRFISLDGVDWSDRKAKEALYVGTAIIDFMRLTKAKDPDLKPVIKDTVNRVVGAAALKMARGNLILVPKPLANSGTPIIINNACVSWHRLAETFTFCNARSYIGTMFEITEFEAVEVVTKLLEKHHAKPIAHALWSAQREVYEEGGRCPYVVTGVYPQTLRVKQHDMTRTIRRLESALRAHKRELAQTPPENEARYKAVADCVAYYEREAAHFRELVLDKAPPGLVRRNYTRRDLRG
jgi:hypothetical protein